MSEEFLPYGRQQISDEDIAAVAAVLRGPMITQGPAVAELERAVCDFTGAAHAVAVSSGTAALHAAASAAGLGPGDVALVPPITFAASANCIRYVGAEVRFIDIDPETLCIDVEAAARVAGEDERVKAIVAVSFAGLPVQLEPLLDLDLVVIEDGCHAFGGHRQGAVVGGPGGAHMTCLSMHPVKAITSGEGGLLTTEDAELAARARRFREHGIERSPTGADGPWAYDITELGFNYRITDFQCALAESQLGRLAEWVRARNEIADAYRGLLADEPRVRLPPAAPDGSLHGYHLFPIVLEAGAEARRAVFEGLRAAQIGVQVHYVPIYRFATYSSGIDPSGFPRSEDYYSGAISLPIFPAMEASDVERVVGELRRLLPAD